MSQKINLNFKLSETQKKYIEFIKSNGSTNYVKKAMNNLRVNFSSCLNI